MLYRHKIQIDWELHKRERIKQHIANNIKENRNRRPHKYKVGDEVLIIMKPYETDKKPKISELRASNCKTSTIPVVYLLLSNQHI